MVSVEKINFYFDGTSETLAPEGLETRVQSVG
jgi:hypothetical protein